jgi:arylsulfatase A-like enzyme
MSKYIARRDPTKPAFWYMSFISPHQPLTPLPTYMDIYRSFDVEEPFYGDWSDDTDALPHALRMRRNGKGTYSDSSIRDARRAFYSLATHIDHQIGLVIGLLREEGLLDDTVIMFTSDHGNMLGNHGIYDIGLMYESVAKIPMVLIPQMGREEVGQNLRDDRLAVQADVFPTLADLCGIPIPDTVEGKSLIGNERRDHVYGEHGEDGTATRMIRDARYKLIYYPVGDRYHLFDLQDDPNELRDLSDDAAHASVKDRVTGLLVENLYGSDLEWLDGDKLVGLPEPEPRAQHPNPSRAFGNQRGWRFGHKGPARFGSSGL